ncbi:MAG: LPXTG cell wall anchor domain-containing protein [Microbacteriaceae bacterium]|nr:LPXTG cell wall anchor domain-containing protein [Microbacteriaceae bacterium]
MKITQKLVSAAAGVALVAGGIGLAGITANAVGISGNGTHGTQAGNIAPGAQGNGTHSHNDTYGKNPSYGHLIKKGEIICGKGGECRTYISVKDGARLYIDGKHKDLFVKPGDKVKYVAGGFKPGETVKISLHSEIVDLGTVKAGPTGGIFGEFIVPKDFTEGIHHFIAQGAEKRVELEFEVRNDKAEDDKKKLAKTGSEQNFVALAGAIALVAAGAGVFAIRRRNA